MFCKYCGAKIDDDSAFCPRCGKTLQGGKKASSFGTTNSADGGGASGSSFKKLLYGVGALLCAIPLPVAEYRRLVLGEFGVQYWLLCAPILLSCYLLYRLIAEDQIKEEQERVRQAKMKGVTYEDKTSKIRTNVLSICCLVVAALGFGSSIIIQMVF